MCDLGPSEILAPRFSGGEGYFSSSAGTNRAVSRTRTLEIPIMDNDKIDHIRTMWFEGCEIRVICLGWNSHIVWDLDSEINLVPYRGGPRSFTAERLVLNTDVFLGSVYQSDNIIGGVPWACTTSTLDTSDNNYYLSTPAGWQGNRWQDSDTDASITSGGAFSGTGSLTMEMYFPLEGADVQMSGDWLGQMRTLDHSGATLTTTAKNLSTNDATIDDGTWKIAIQVDSASEQPVLYITDPGDIASNRAGVCIDCTDLSAEAGSAPSWSS